MQYHGQCLSDAEISIKQILVSMLCYMYIVDRGATDSIVCVDKLKRYSIYSMVWCKSA